MQKWLIWVGLALFALNASAQDFTELGSFKTPSGNIHCTAYLEQASKKSELRCDILQMTATTPPRPKDCDLDWGDSFWMQDRGKAVRLCHGDTVANPNNPVLAYGKIWKVQGFQCDVTQQRLRCVNRDEHGFELSRAKQRIF